VDQQILIGTAISIGIIHTFVGPDHYLPFIMIGRARNWSFSKTLSITIVCGIGHVLGSIILGVIGVSLGIAVGILENIETFRGELASWLIIGFGTAYAFWGLRLGLRSIEHEHEHPHNHETAKHHIHPHHHLGSHAHIHGRATTITPWVLFIIFILGPCEPLIPILMYPAAQGSWMDLTWITLAFSIATISIMVLIVSILYFGILKLKLGYLEKYSHALAGIIIALSGLAIKIFSI
jgi:ABC-type nickel/cobalt efflux system permease component RcnA